VLHGSRTQKAPLGDAGQEGISERLGVWSGAGLFTPPVSPNSSELQVRVPGNARVDVRVATGAARAAAVSLEQIRVAVGAVKVAATFHCIWTQYKGDWPGRPAESEAKAGSQVPLICHLVTASLVSSFEHARTRCKQPFGNVLLLPRNS